MGAAQMVVMVTFLARLWFPSGLQGTFPMHGFNLIFIEGIKKKVELSYPRLQKNQHSGSCIGMSGIGLQLATDEELLGF